MMRRMRRFDRGMLALTMGFLGIFMILFRFPAFSILLGITGVIMGTRYSKNVKRSCDDPKRYPIEIKFARIGILMGWTATALSILYLIEITFFAVNLLHFSQA